MADSLKSVTYAEVELGVHKVYESAQLFRDQLENALSEITALRDRKRNLDSALVDREMMLLIDVRGKHPDVSEAAVERMMKQAKNDDDEHREIREQINAVLRKIDDAEAMKVVAEVDIKIAVSRLQELGGYLEYLAAVKQHQARDANETKENTA